MDDSSEFLNQGIPAPPFSLKAEVSERPVNLESAAGPLLLVYHSYQTVSTVAEVIRAVRQKYPLPEQTLIAGVADLRVVPRLLRGTAKAFIKSAYYEASKEVPAGQDPADHIVILADWDGALFEAYLVPRTDQQAALVLVSDAKTIAGSYFGSQPAQAALSLLDNLLLSNNK
jgi:hypothetical protein